MTFSAAALATVLGLLFFVGSYGLAYLWLAFALLRRRSAVPRARSAGGHPVTVVIPSHDEGPALVDTVTTVVRQDHAGPVVVWVLVADRSDTSVEALRRAFPGRGGDERHERLLARGNREVHVWFVGKRPKRDKLLFALSMVETPFVAFLDADHRADRSWLTAALRRFETDDCVAVQSRRHALSRSRLVEIWDATESHLGNEAINAVVGRDFAFFTGTTAVFRRETVVAHGFADCVTEDTYLSWECLLAGQRIVHEDAGGSYEEVAPTLPAFVARRRRWSAGHTKAFFEHARRLLRHRTGLWRTLRLLLYGAFYLVPVAIFALLNVQASHALVQLPARATMGALSGAAGLGLFASWLFTRRVGPAPLLAGVACALPLSTAAVVGALRITGSETYHHLLSFPWSNVLAWIELALWWTPLLPLAAGNRRLASLSWRELGLVVLTWPLLVLVNLYAGLLGFIDFCRGRSVWSKVERQNVVSPNAVPNDVARGLTTATARAFRWAPFAWGAAALLLLCLLNELLATNECGVERALLWPPLIMTPRHPVSLHVDVDSRRVDDDTGALTVRVVVGNEGGTRIDLSVSVDDQVRKQSTVERAGALVSHEERFPLGWQTRRITVVARGASFVCRRDRAVATAVRELQDGALLVNGEPFLVKGVIPSFSVAPLDLPLDAGLGAIKALGANAVRFYHQPSPETLAAVASHELLMLAQPDRSTWQNVDVTTEGDRRKLARRYEELLRATDGFPFLLMDNVGNELELGRNWERASADVRVAIGQLRGRRFPLSYSTYFTFLDYPVDVLGVNMLDTGETYWGKGLAVLRGLGRPFYATELGGFTAFFERPPTALRLRRLERDWERLLAAGALGAFIYESHDNWAQSVPPGKLNDPLTPEMPDDTRGLWDRDNQPKPELGLVRRLFSDVAVAVTERRADALAATVTNRRRFALRGVEARLGAQSVALGDLGPGETRDATWRVSADTPAGTRMSLSYRTHHGLAGRSEVDVVVRADAATVLNDDFVATARGRGYLWRSSTLELLQPGNERRSVALGDVLRSVDDLQWSFDSGDWRPWHAGAPIRGGAHAFRFRLPRPASASCLLLLAGVGAKTAQVTIGDRTREIETHAYREVSYSFTDLGVQAGDPVTLAVDRRQIEYIAGRVRPDRRPVLIDFEAPRVFCPQEIELPP